MQVPQLHREFSSVPHIAIVITLLPEGAARFRSELLSPPFAERQLQVCRKCIVKRVVQRNIVNNTKHNNARDGLQTPEYKAWSGMKQRCYSPRCRSYRNYGARGITVCDRWRDSFENFLADMGRKPAANLSIDRIDNDGNYEPGNCRWATWTQQANNTRRSRKKKAPASVSCEQYIQRMASASSDVA